MTATLAQGVLAVGGTPEADVISVDARQGMVRVAGVKSFPAAKARRVGILGGKGDDAITARGLGVAARIDEGAGNDAIDGVSEIGAARVAPVASPTAIPSTCGGSSS